MTPNRSTAFAIVVALLMAGCLRAPAPDTEKQRVSAHLERVAERLATAPSDHLEPVALSARAETLAWLDEYRAHGVFPQNHVVPGERVPVFIDAHGTPCAVGYLLLRSGETALVDEIVRTNNLVRIQELKDDARLVAWLDARGITLEEAAAVQPTYDGFPPTPEPRARDYYADITVALTAASAAFAGITFSSTPEERSSWVGLANVASIVGHTVLLANHGDGPTDRPDWTIGVNTTAAVASVFAVAKLISDHVNDAPASETTARRLQPTISHGPNGLGVGFTLNH